MLVPRNQDIGVRVRIWNAAGNPVDVTGFVTGVRWGLGDVSAVGTGSLGVDATVSTASLTLSRAHELRALFRDYARVVVDAGLTNDPMVPVRTTLETGDDKRRVTGLGRNRALNIADVPILGPAFDGFLGDGFRWSGSGIELLARDPAKLLQDTQLDNITTFGSEAGTAIQVVLQQLMTHHLGGRAPTLRVIGDPDALINDFMPRDQSVWDAMQGLVNRIGWYLGYVRLGGVYALTLMEPPRAGPTTTLSVGWEDMLAEDLTWSTKDVRNSVTVEFLDITTGEINRITRQDAWSIKNVTGGVVKHSHIAVANDSGVNTVAAAERLADAFLADLGRVLAQTQIELPFNPGIQLFTGLNVLNPARAPDAALYAVNSVQHEIIVSQSGSRFRTTVLAAGQVIGGKRKWLDHEPRPGSPGDVGTHLTQLLAPTVTIEAASPGVLVRIAELSPDAAGVELHLSDTGGFVPDGNSLVGRGQAGVWALSGMTPGETFFARAREFDGRGGYGPWSAEVDAVAGSVGSGAIDPGLVADVAYAKGVATYVETRQDAWNATQSTVADRQAFWEAAAATLDGTLETGTVTSATANSVTDSTKDWADLGIQPGDQIRVVMPDGTHQVRAVIGVTGGTLTVADAWVPALTAGLALEAGRVDRITARADTSTTEYMLSEFGDIQFDVSEVQGVAGQALSDAGAAQSTANSAASAASGAQGTANTALANAGTAQGTANQAISDAEDAQDTADGIASELNNPVAIDSAFASIQNSAREARSALTRQQSHLVLSGLVDSATASTLVDANGSFETNGVLPGDVIVLLDGAGAGIQIDVAAVSESVLTLAQNWPVGKQPAPGDSYVVGRPQSVSTSYSLQTAEGFQNIVTTLNSDPDDPGQFTAVVQLNDALYSVAGGLESEIESIRGIFDKMTLVTGDGRQRVTGDGRRRVIGQSRLQFDNGMNAAFTLIYQNQNQLQFLANGLDGANAQMLIQADMIQQRVTNGEFTSTVDVLNDAIDLKVDGDGVVTAINLSPEGAKISGLKVEIDTSMFTVSGPTGVVTIANGAIDTPQLAAGAITTDKLTAGEIDISTTGRTAGRINARNAAGVRQAAFGNVGGLHGAPAGAYGLAGALGAGVWIEGAVKAIDRNVFTVTGNAFSAGSITAGASGSRSDQRTLRAAPFIVPPGRKWLIGGSIVRLGNGSYPVAVRYVELQAQLGMSLVSEIPAGTHSNPIDLLTAVGLIAVQGFTGPASGAYTVEWSITEVDA